MNRLIGVVIAAPLTLGVVSGCSSEQPAKVLTTVTVTASGNDTSPEKSTGPEVTTEDQSDAAEGTANLGDTVEVGDWAVKVTDVDKNADKIMTKANMFNGKPKGQYVLVTYNATYNGSERTADAWVDLTWSLTTNDSQIHDPTSAVTPADEHSWPTSARKGGTVKLQVAFDVKPDLLPGSILSVEGYNKNFETVYADFVIH
jgi:hypothetical protein